MTRPRLEPNIEDVLQDVIQVVLFSLLLMSLLAMSTRAPSNLPAPTLELLAKMQKGYSLTGLWMGFGCVLVSVPLIGLGATGTVS